MKIRRIETIRAPDFPNLLWLQLHTDDGLSGLGETFYIPSAVEAIIHDFAAPLLLGQSAFDRERHWQTLFSYANFFGHAGAEMRAISAIDIALWDLLGKHTGQPVLQLLGGQTRDSIRIYNTCVDTPLYADQTAFLERPGELAQSLLAQGITAMKVWPWDRFAPQMQVRGFSGPAGWSAVGPVGHDLLPEELAQGLWTVQEIRRAVGDRMQIALEGHSRWDLNCALRIARALEPYDVMWMEDFLQPDSANDLARLARESRIPQAVSERLFTRHAFEGEAARAQADLATAQEALRRAREMALGDLARTQSQTQSARERQRLVAEQLEPAAERVAAGAELAYRHGASSALDLLDARRSLRAVRIERVNADADAAKAQAESQAARTTFEGLKSP